MFFKHVQKCCAYRTYILLAHAEYAGGTPDVRYSYAGISKDFCAYENYFINFHTLLIRFSHTQWCDRALRYPICFSCIPIVTVFLV